MALQFDGDNSYGLGDNRVVIDEDGVAAAASAGAVASANTWNHACAVHSASNNRVAYLNGVVGTANTTNRAPSSWNHCNIGALVSSTPEVFVPLDGRVAEVGIWNVALTAAEVLSLSQGVSPIFVRPKALVRYWPVYGVDAETCWISRNVLTETGTMAQAEHCPIFLPSYPIIGFAPSAAEVNGTFNVTIDPVTLSATGDVDIAGSFAQTIAAVTLSASADLLINGSLAQTIAPVTLAATGKVIISGTFAQTIDAVTLAASGDVDISGTFGQTIAPVTLAASGDVDIAATFNQTIAAVTLSAAGDLDINATFAQTIAAVTLSADADLLIQATFGQTIDPVTLVAAGTAADVRLGTFNVTIDPVTLVAAGDVDISATFAQTIDPVTLSAAGDVDISGTFGVTIDPVTLAANATISGGAISGTFDQTIAAFTLTASATISQPVVPGIPDTGGSGNRSHGGGGPRYRNLNDDEDRFAELLKEWRAKKEAPKLPNIPDAISGVPKATELASLGLLRDRGDGIESGDLHFAAALDSPDLLDRVRQTEATFDRAMQAYEAALFKVEQARTIKAKKAAAQARQAAFDQEQQARAQAMLLALERELARLAYEDFLDEEDEIMLLAA